jgi:hypothetical protein
MPNKNISREGKMGGNVNIFMLTKTYFSFFIFFDENMRRLGSYPLRSCTSKS